jgi:hypothetical protein
VNDPFADFRAQLVAAAAPARRRRTRGLLLIAAALVVAGTATAAVVRPGAPKPSKPLHGQLVTHNGTNVSRYRVSVWPYLSAGRPGWCVSVGFTRGGVTGCGLAMAVGTPIQIAVSAVGPPSEFVAAMVGPNVATVRLGTQRFVPRTDRRLPPSWRAVIAQIKTPSTRPPATAPPPGTRGSGRPPSRPLSGIPQLARDVAPLPLDRRGHVIAQPPVRQSALQTPAHSVSPAHIPKTGCALTGGPKPRTIRVAAKRAPTPVATVGPALRPCFVATYAIHGRYLQAALLLDATNPARRAPDLPGSVRAADGITRAPGDIFARRSGRAWIVVRAGPPSARRALLAQLKARY